MIEYNITKDPNIRGFIIRGDFDSEYIPVNIPETDPDLKKMHFILFT
jgi:hypothetical protein